MSRSDEVLALDMFANGSRARSTISPELECLVIGGPRIMRTTVACPQGRQDDHDITSIDLSCLRHPPIKGQKAR